MRLSFMSFSCPDLDLDAFLQTAKRYGYDAVEPRIDAGHAHGIEPGASPAFLREAMQKAQALDLRYACVASSCRFSDPATAAEHVAHAKRVVELAAAVGAPAIRVFGGPIPQGVSREQSADSIAESLSALADLTALHQVYVCIETHDDWCDPNLVADILSRVDKPYIAANWDIMHPVTRGNATMAGAFEVLRPWIRHVHVHDCVIAENRRLAPIGEGDIDHKTAGALLKAAGYTGAVSGEWINWEPYDVHLPRELAALRRYFG